VSPEDIRVLVDLAEARGYVAGHADGYLLGHLESDEQVARLDEDVIEQRLEDARIAGYDDGFEHGHVAGFDEGREVGYESGLESRDYA
jgi:uncharacterized protein YdbL (DUF1318 family)